jgi:hypothetical protein
MNRNTLVSIFCIVAIISIIYFLSPSNGSCSREGFDDQTSSNNSKTVNVNVTHNIGEDISDLIDLQHASLQNQPNVNNQGLTAQQNAINNWEETVSSSAAPSGAASSGAAPSGAAPSGAMPPTLQQINEVENAANQQLNADQVAANQLLSDSSLDNYNYFKKNGIPLVYHGPSNSSAKILVHRNDYVIMLTAANGNTTYFRMNKAEGSIFDIFNSSSSSDTASNNSSSETIPQQLANVKFYDSAGNVAKIFRASNGKYVIQVNQVNGVQVIYTTDNTYTYDTNNSRSFDLGVNANGVTTVTQSTLQGEQLNSNIENNTISNGVPANMIAPENKDLYILKSEIVPPVCPRCPSICSKDIKQQCPPCPSCARCPSGSSNFTYSGNNNQVSGSSNQSVANISPDNAYSEGENSTDKYSKYRSNNKFLPVPVVSNFSTFGM